MQPDRNKTQPDETAQAVFGDRAAHYATSEVHRSQAELAKLVDLVRPRPDWSCLDVATGTGHTAFAFAPHIQEVTAVDVTQQMLHEAQKLQQENGLKNVRFTSADAHDIPYPSATFDLVISRLAPHHFVDIAKALAEFRRVLKPNGTLLIHDRSVPEDDFIDETMNTLDLYHDRSHIRQYRPSEWTTMLNDANFEVDHCALSHKSRPLTLLTKDVVAEDIQHIEKILSVFDAQQCEKLGLTKTDGERFINHWYVTVSAKRRDA